MLIPRPRPPRLTLRSLRPLHSSARICDYVAPPDPISNIRPILYDDPVSWKLQRQQLDAFNDNFWRDSNTRFEVAKAAALSGLPPHSTTQQREERLGKFYRNWVLQEATRQLEYNAEWRRRSMEEIVLALRVSYHGLKARFMS
ncbi:hypothetical protein EDB83DRAFT_2503988 [Lactarius deliciosus]|nr:hypothetical protein EDB83DRAFT_2503988 [Lactarius deliciosus]